MPNSIKRSDVNRIMREADKFIRSFGYVLPPFAYWSPSEFKTRKADARWIVEHNCGWDITDYGLGKFAEEGLFLFTVRNGNNADLSRGRGMLYAEKAMISRKDQYSPMHRHNLKAEDIINRGGGTLVLELYGDTGGKCDRSKGVSVMTDGVMRQIAPGQMLKLAPGESARSLLRSGKLCPLVSSGGDMLIARVCRQPSIFVLSDPDVIANHGLWRGDNAVLAMSFVSLMRNGDGPVVTPGAPIRQPVKGKPNVFGLAFEPPFVLITIAAFVAIAIAVWLAAMRFGPPAAEAPDRPPGIHTLIEVAARLLGARAGDRLLRRYAELVVLDLGRRLHAPRTLSGMAEIGAWLDASRQGESSELKYAVLAQRIDSAGPAETVTRAAELHRWREELLNGR